MSGQSTHSVPFRHAHSCRRAAARSHAGRVSSWTKKRHNACALLMLTVRGLFRGGNCRFFFFHCHGAFSDAFAKVGKLGPAHRAFALHFNLIEARRMHREHALDALAVADATDRKSFVQTAAPFADHYTGENLDALLVAFHHFGVHANGVANPEVHGVLAK